MFIELKVPVSVRKKHGDGFATFPKGMKVNYSCKKQHGSMVHTITGCHEYVVNRILHKDVLEHTTITPLADRPEYL